jgi:hypothetical protein
VRSIKEIIEKKRGEVTEAEHKKFDHMHLRPGRLAWLNERLDDLEKELTEREEEMIKELVGALENLEIGGLLNGHLTARKQIRHLVNKYRKG